MSNQRDLARALLASARRHSHRFRKEGSSGRRENGENSENDETQSVGPQLINQSLSELIADQGWGEQLKIGDLFTRWDEIVGPDIAQNAKPMRLTDGKLLIEARSTAWATQLKLMSDDLKRRIAAEGLELTGIEVVGPRSPSWRRGGWTVKGGRGPRDTYG